MPGKPGVSKKARGDWLVSVGVAHSDCREGETGIVVDLNIDSFGMRLKLPDLGGHKVEKQTKGHQQYNGP